MTRLWLRVEATVLWFGREYLTSRNCCCRGSMKKVAGLESSPLVYLLADEVLGNFMDLFSPGSILTSDFRSLSGTYFQDGDTTGQVHHGTSCRNN